MPAPYRQPHCGIFAKIPYAPQGAVGFVPATWIKSHALPHVPNANALPGHLLDRVQVRATCRDPAIPELFGYVCAMAWGMQGAGPGSRGHVALAWASRHRLIPKLAMLRGGGLIRTTAYKLFTGVRNRIPGLGPAYFTKLLYFFSPEPDCYIMDQHTGKSLNLLTGEWVVRMAGHDAVSTLNKAGNYQAFCEEVDHLAALLGQTGEQIEEKMFSNGAKGGPRGGWRTHVRGNWPGAAPPCRYSRTRMHRIYPHISLSDF